MNSPEDEELQAAQGFTEHKLVCCLLQCFCFQFHSSEGHCASKALLFENTSLPPLLCNRGFMTANSLFYS